MVSGGRHQLRISVSNTTANAFYAGTPYVCEARPEVSGLTEAPALYRAVRPGAEFLPSSQD